MSKEHECPQCGQDMRLPPDAYAQLHDRLTVLGQDLRFIENLIDGKYRTVPGFKNALRAAFRRIK